MTIAEDTFFDGLVDILLQNIEPYGRRVIIDGVRGALSSRYAELLGASGGLLQFLGVAARFIRIGRTSDDHSIILHKSLQPYYSQQRNEAYFRRASSRRGS